MYLRDSDSTIIRSEANKYCTTENNLNLPKNICVVGGGTAGFVAALILKKAYPSISIQIIESSKIGTIGVGEGSTEHWKEFMDYMGFNKAEMLTKSDATFKAGIMFKDWSKNDYLQTVEGAYNILAHDYPVLYGKLISDGRLPKDLVEDESWTGNIFWTNDVEEILSEFPVAQFHFNTVKLNDYLHEKAQSLGIKIVDDIIEDVVTDDNGIKSISSKENTYEADFFIDCTGFKRILLNKLGAEWESYSKYLKMNRAIVFQTPDEDTYPMWTLAQAMKYGWMFRIPVWGRKGNGYIFDSNYINADEAQREVEEMLGEGIDVRKEISFDPGAVKNSWIKNCVAIGLSASFVEPLEATSIGTSIQQSFLLTDRILNYSEVTINKYNKEVTSILNDIRDFIALHYITDRDDSNFWKDQKDVPLPPSLEENLTQWKNRLPTTGDFDSTSDYKLFDKMHYILVMHGLGLFDTEKIKEQYEMLPQNQKDLAQRVVNDSEYSRSNYRTIPHKEIIRLVRLLNV